MPAIQFWLYNYCRSNPLNAFGEAADARITALPLSFSIDASTTIMTKKDQSLIASLDRISKYLPNASLDPLSRVKLDDKGRLWVDEDTILIVCGLSRSFR
jgi:hypothetical protein